MSQAASEALAIERAFGFVKLAAAAFLNLLIRSRFSAFSVLQERVNSLISSACSEICRRIRATACVGPALSPPDDDALRGVKLESGVDGVRTAAMDGRGLGVQIASPSPLFFAFAMTAIFALGVAIAAIVGALFSFSRMLCGEP